MIELFLDTSDSKNVKARLAINGKNFEESFKALDSKPDSILLLIEKLCTNAEISIDNIDKIFVKEGPGSYTGLKVGASVANTLSFGLKKSVNDLEFGTLVEPKYD